MEPIDRRTALTLGGVGLLSTAVGGGGLLWQRQPSALDALTGVALQEPEVLRSRAGSLDVRLEAASGPHDVAGRKATTLGYNGGLPGPTLRIRPGDTLGPWLSPPLLGWTPVPGVGWRQSSAGSASPMAANSVRSAVGRPSSAGSHGHWPVSRAARRCRMSANDSPRRCAPWMNRSRSMAATSYSR